MGFGDRAGLSLVAKSLLGMLLELAISRRAKIQWFISNQDGDFLGHDGGQASSMERKAYFGDYHSLNFRLGFLAHTEPS